MLSLIGAALAGGLAPPVRPTHLVSVDLGVEAQAVGERVDGCTGERCVGWAAGHTSSLRVGTQPVAGLGLSAELGLGRLSMDGADFTQRVLSAGGGLSLSLPDRPLSPAVVLEGRAFTGPPGAASAGESAGGWSADAGLLLAFRGDQVSAWVGPQLNLGRSELVLEPEAIALALRPALPASLVAGAELYSEPLASWKRHPGRVSAGMTLAVGYGSQLGLRVGYLY